MNHWAGLPFYNRLSWLGAGSIMLLMLGLAFSHYSKHRAAAPVNAARAESWRRIELEKIKVEAELEQSRLEAIKVEAELEQSRLEAIKKASIPVSKQVEASLDGYPVKMSEIERIDACTNLKDQNGYRIGAVQRGIFYKNQSCLGGKQ